jgi:hypothetical protein
MEFALSGNPDRFLGEGFQYLWALKKIMQTGTLTVDEVRLFSLRYSVNIPNDVPEESIPVVEDPPRISFTDETLLLKYTNYSENENQNHVFRMVVSEAYRIICFLVKALRKEMLSKETTTSNDPIEQALWELETMENFLREASEEEIEREAIHIFEQVKLNFNKIENSPEQHLASRFRAVLSRVKNYLLKPQAP